MANHGIDDAVDAIAVHLGGGTFGVLSLAFFEQNIGILYNWVRDKQGGATPGSCAVLCSPPPPPSLVPFLPLPTCPAPLLQDATSGHFLAWQIAGLVTIMVWSGSMAFLMFKTLDKLNHLRISALTEQLGTDGPGAGALALPAPLSLHGSGAHGRATLTLPPPSCRH